MSAKDLAHGLARHVRTLRDRAHADTLDEAEAQYLGDAAVRRIVRAAHRDHTNRS